MDLLIQYGVSLTPCLQQSPVQAADGPAHPIWSQPNTMLTIESSSKLLMDLLIEYGVSLTLTR